MNGNARKSQSNEHSQTYHQPNPNLSVCFLILLINHYQSSEELHVYKTLHVPCMWISKLLQPLQHFSVNISLLHSYIASVCIQRWALRHWGPMATQSSTMYSQNSLIRTSNIRALPSTWQALCARMCACANSISAWTCVRTLMKAPKW